MTRTIQVSVPHLSRPLPGRDFISTPDSTAQLQAMGPATLAAAARAGDRETTPKTEGFMADVSAAMEKLAKAAPKLNRATDAANAIFKAVEDYLGTLSLGIESSVFVTADDVADDEGENAEGKAVEVEVRSFLEYARVGGRFRLAIGAVKVRSFGTDELSRQILPTIAWDQATRLEKLVAVEKLPDLIEQLATEAERLAEAADSASSAVAKILKAVKN